MHDIHFWQTFVYDIIGLGRDSTCIPAVCTFSASFCEPQQTLSELVTTRSPCSKQSNTAGECIVVSGLLLQNGHLKMSSTFEFDLLNKPTFLKQMDILRKL